MLVLCLSKSWSCIFPLGPIELIDINAIAIYVTYKTISFIIVVTQTNEETNNETTKKETERQINK